MRLLFCLLFIPLMVSAQSSIDVHRWYLRPNGQELLISIDDLHDETIIASPLMDWGRNFVSSVVLKKDVLVAIIDGGIDIDHPELKDHIAYNSSECFAGSTIPPKDSPDNDGNGYKGDCAGWDFVEGHNRPEDLDGHGTHVTGVIRSVMHGVQGNFKFLPLKVFAPGEGKQAVKSVAPLSSRLARAFEYALSRKADVIHLSVGWPKSFMTYELEQVIRKVIDSGIIIVAAAGNSSQRASIYPCQLEGVICVGALRADGSVARFSNWGAQVDIFAPGEKILSTIPLRLAPRHISRKGYDFKNGTSQAAPFISGTMALMKGHFVDETSNTLYARLMKGARPSVNGEGLRGAFHLEESFRINQKTFVYPEVKGLNAVVVDGEGQYQLKIKFKNYLQSLKDRFPVKLNCEGSTIDNEEQLLPSMDSLEVHVLTFQGKLSGQSNTLNCWLQSDKQKWQLRLKVEHSLPAPYKEMVVSQDDLWVINTRTGGRSRFMTLNTLGGATPAPFYHILGEKNLVIFHQGQRLGEVVMKKGCTFLRVWQLDLDGDQSNELMVESMCNDTHLYYQFFNLELNEMFPGVAYRPNLTILNYDDFEVIPNKGLPPSFRFINAGFSIPSESPWESNVSTQALHYYELFPVKDGGGLKYDVRILEEPESWVKSLGLRYLPSYQVFHYVKGKLLIKLGQKTAWVDVKTQKAAWAGLDDILLTGSRKQELRGTEDYILQSFLTPFEYRGFVFKGIKLRFKQEDRFDPLLDILGTQINGRGYLSVLRSFQNLIYLQYDFDGNLLSKETTVVDRFDFLTAQDLIASVVNFNFQDGMIQFVDGSKINTDYIDVIKNQKLVSYEIPRHCVTQLPVVMEGRRTLPVFCAKSREEFVMKFIEI